MSNISYLTTMATRPKAQELNEVALESKSGAVRQYKFKQAPNANANNGPIGQATVGQSFACSTSFAICSGPDCSPSTVFAGRQVCPVTASSNQFCCLCQEKQRMDRLDWSLAQRKGFMLSSSKCGVQYLSLRG